MNHYHSLFLDFDDTLYDTYGNSVIALRETFDEFHLEHRFPDPQVFYDAYWAANIDLWAQYARGEITRDYLIVERFRRPLSAAPSPHADEHLCLDMNNRFLDHCSSKPGVIDGAHELMDYLRSKGYRMHICSNGFHEVQFKKLAACGLSDYFDSVILSEDAGANKPSKAFFDYALRQSGASPATTIMIGDNLRTDIAGAHAAGLDTILFNRWGERPSDIPTYTVDSLRDIMHIL